LGLLQLLHLEHDHGFVNGLEQGVGEAWAAVEEAALEDIEQQELDQRPGGQSVEKLFLMVAAAIEIRLEKGGGEAEGHLVCSVPQDLLGLEGAVGVVACDPVAEALREGVVVERMLQIPHGTIHHSDAIYKSFVMDELGPKETDIPV